jgi:hypothetical protein
LPSRAFDDGGDETVVHRPVRSRTPTVDTRKHSDAPRAGVEIESQLRAITAAPLGFKTVVSRGRRRFFWRPSLFIGCVAIEPAVGSFDQSSKGRRQGAGSSRYCTRTA